MRGLFCVLCLAFAGPAVADEAAYDACVGPAFEMRFNEKFAERFPSEDPTAVDPILAQSVTSLVRAGCRRSALAACTNERSCLVGLQKRWGLDAARLTRRVNERLASIDPETLPALTVRRLSDRSRWVIELPCDNTDPAICATNAASHALGSLERLDQEVERLSQ